LIREDTIEYNADAFNVLPNATVEDLLKRMPGIEVERDGTVKAQGETVQQVLVDGKEFFGTDPKMATKNLPAAVVDKVQVFDQKSDQAQFSGVDDGNEQKTINLELKEDAKAGIFGTIAAGGGTESTYTGRASVNRFDKKLQVSFLGQANNTNQQGFSFNEYSNFMGGIQNMMRGGRGGGGSRASFGGNGVQLGQDISDGFTNTAAGGVNLNYDLKKGTRLNVSYFYNNVRKDLDAQTYQENFLGEVPFISEDSSRDITQNGNHRANLTFRHEFSKRTNIIVRGGLTVNESEFTSVGESFTLSEEGITQNASLQDYISNSESMRGNGSMTLRHRFKKRGRNITLDLNGSTSDGTDVGDLYAENSFFTRGRLETDTVLQDQNQVSDQYNYRAQLNYTEPLGKRRYMTFQLQRSTNFNEVDKEVFDVESGDAIFNNDLSNHYDRFFTTNRVGIEFRKNHRKYNFTIGLDGQTSVLDGRIFYPDSTVGINQDFRAILPDARFDYNFASSKRLSLRYSTNQNEPSIEQLQPIIDNTDPLNIYIGNPDLVPEYTHRLRLRYFSFNQYNYTNFFATINANYTENSITNAKFIDTLFRQITTPQNVDNAFNLTGFLNYGTPFQLGVKLRANINLNSSYSRNIVFVNNTQNSTDTYTNGFDLRLENREKDVVDISIGAKVSTNLTQYSINTELDQSWLNQ
ncbi:MAG: outer membrane beta-barrel protein, partial [Bacteroidota bacterium]